MANIYACTECGQSARSTSLYINTGTRRVCEDCFRQDGWQYTGQQNDTQGYEQGMAFSARYQIDY